MREILFRGRRIDNGEWVEGYYAKAKHIISKKEVHVIFDLDLELFPHSEFSSYEEVIPETIGQYTGMKDKNGRRIFEGDILQGDDYPFFHSERNERNYFAEVVWFDNSPAFGLLTHKNPQSKVRGISHGNCEYMEDFETGNWEVIGNIYDNKELLKEDADENA